MALPTCGKCGQHLFEIHEIEPVRSRYKMYTLQCTSCGTVVGVTEYNNASAVVEKAEKAIKQAVSEVSSRVHRIESLVVDLYNRRH